MVCVTKCKWVLRLAVASALLFGIWIPGNAGASALVPQMWLPGDSIFGNVSFLTPLPVFGPGYNAVLPRVDARRYLSLNVEMKEIDQQVLPATLKDGSPGFGKTRVWAYEIKDSVTGKVLGPANWPAVTVDALRNLKTAVKYINNLPTFNAADPAGPGLVQGIVTTDKTLHWADPFSPLGMMNPCKDNPGGTDLSGQSCAEAFIGPVPAVAHLHGGETPSSFDGGPEQWFTPDGRRGKDYQSLYPTDPNAAVYLYDNRQEPGTLWFHDHALGATRTNVYSGLAAFYLLRDPSNEPLRLPSGPYEIEMAIQDRQFDTAGQLFFPDGSPNGSLGTCGDGSPEDPCFNGPPPNPQIHPFWNPEFFGDVAVVNGAPWPVLEVEPRRYYFRLLDGSNARFYSLTFGAAGEPSPPVYVIGTDGNYLNAPVKVNGRTISVQGGAGPLELPTQVFMAPGERAGVIVDFSGLAAGTTITLTNNAPAPFPDGLVPGVDVGQLNMDKIMRFKVIALKEADKSCKPASGCKRPDPIVRLADGKGKVASGVTITKKRQIILKEHEAEGPPGGPLEVFVNNTRWEGLRSPSIASIFPVDGVSELPGVGTTELWEVINLTADTHPMHTHLVQFQVLSRQFYDRDAYLADWEAAFPADIGFSPECTGGVFCPGYGPPFPYDVPNADGALGGNPAVSGYLQGSAFAPDPEEAGWKDTAKAHPYSVTRYLLRWAPTSASNRLAKPGRNLFPFDPTEGPGYVWHCHIVDHEDNEMMRPYKVTGGVQ